MIIKVKSKKTGIIYSSDMSDLNNHSILQIDFCTSYTEVNVQDVIEINGEKSYKCHDIVIQPVGSKPCWIDLISIQGYDEGEFVN